MSQLVKPELYFVVCDKCGTEEKIPYRESSPPDWSYIEMTCTVPITWDYCRECTVTFVLEMPLCIESKEGS
jgi:hypothetical protein